MTKLLQILPSASLGGATFLVEKSDEIWKSSVNSHSFILTNQQPSSFFLSSNLILTQTSSKNFALLFVKALSFLKSNKKSSILLYGHGFLGCAVCSCFYLMRPLLNLFSFLFGWASYKTINHHHALVSQSLFKSNSVPAVFLLIDIALRLFVDFNIYTSERVRNFSFLSSFPFFRRGVTIYPCPVKSFGCNLTSLKSHCSDRISPFFYARLSPQKNFPYFLESMRFLIHKQVIDSFNVFVPFHQVSDAFRLSRDLFDDHEFTIYGDSHLPSFLESSTAFPLQIVTSAYEPFGMTILELALAGVPSIVPCHTGALELLPQLNRYSYYMAGIDAKSLINSFLKFKNDCCSLEFSLEQYLDNLKNEAFAASNIYSTKFSQLCRNLSSL